MSNSEIETLSKDSDFNLFVLRRWREYLTAAREKHDPVFAGWNAFVAGTAIPADANPEIKQALAAAHLKTIDDVAKVYGEMLAKSDGSEVNPDANREQLRLVLRGQGTPTNIPQADFIQIRGAGGDANILGGLEGAIRDWEAQFGYRGIAPRAMAVQEPVKLVKAHVFVRGNPNNLGAEEPPHFLTILSDGPQPQTFTHGSGRLDLANAVADPSNPVTARVIVNRVWQWHFGKGIVNSPSDFGTRGDLPSHPELLDYLATRFMDEGWSIKKLQRWIMLSRTYQQASADRPEERALDSENKLLWRMNRQRLDYESLRDSVLFVSGQLDQTVGGLPFSLESRPPVPRRTAYAYLQRGRLPGELSSFDFAIPDAHVPQRFLTTVPQQALFLMNSPFITEESHRLAGRKEIDSAKPGPDRVQALYRDIFGRAATTEEAALALDYVKGEEAKQSPVVQNVWQSGLTSFSERGEALKFEPMKYFVDQKWQPASLTPQPVFGDAELSEKGGVPTDDINQAVTRRWTSPVTGVVEITGTLGNKVDEGAEEYRKHWSGGVRARVILNGASTLAEERVNNGKSDVLVREVSVKPGDTIDFAVNAVKSPEDTKFTWTPVITLKGASKPQVWDAHKDFAGPAPLTLTVWEKLAQALFETSEFAFLD